MAEKTPEHQNTEVAQHAAWEALRQSEAKYRRLFENSRDAIITMDPIDIRFTSGNPAALQVFGAGTVEEFVSYGPISLSPERQPDGRLSAEKAREMMAAALREGSHCFEWTHRRINGEEFFADVLLGRIEQDGKAMILATVRDITERKRAEAALRESEARLRTFNEAAFEGIAISEHGILIDANLRLAQLLGYDIAELIGRRVSDLVAPEDRSHVEEKQAAGIEAPYENRLLRKDGSVIIVETQARRCLYSGRPVRLTAVHDLTARKRAEAELGHSEEQFRTLFENMMGGFILAQVVCDPKGKPVDHRLLSANAAFDEMTGLKRSEEVGRTSAELSFKWPPEVASRYYEIALHGGNLHWERFNESLQRWYDIRCFSPTKGQFAMVFYECTGRKLAEESLRETNARIGHLNRVLRSIQEVGHVLNREKDPRKLLNAVCDCLVQTRGYVVVWVGKPEAGSKQVLPVAHSGGKKGFLLHAPITWDDSPSGLGPTGTAIRERRAVVFEDIAMDPRFALWRDDVMAGGSAAIASIPMIHGDRLFGVLTIKADRTNAFDTEEVVLLTGLATDVARALGNLEEESARRGADEALAQSCSLLNAALESTADGLLVVDSQGKVTSFNQQFLKLWRIPPEMAASRDDQKLLQHVLDQLETPAAFLARVEELYRNPQTCSMEKLKFRDGRVFERYSLPQRLGDQVVGRVWSFRDVTANILAEQRLRESQERYALVERATQDGLWDWNLLTNEEYFSPRWKEIVGLMGDELPGRKEAFLNLVHPDDLAAVQEATRQHLETGQRYEIEYRLRHKDGSYRYVLSRAKAIHDAAGRPVRMVGSITDITERKQAEAALAISEERFRKLFEESPVGIAFLGRQREIILTNQRYRDFLGYSEAEIKERGPVGLLHPDDWEASMALSTRLRSGEIPLFHMEQRYIRKDGTIVWADTHITVLRDQDGQFLYTIGWVRDITERKVAEQALRESEERYRRLFEVESDAILLVDRETERFIDANPSALRLYGYTRQELLSLKPQDVSAEPERTRQAIAEGHLLVAHRQHRKKDGTIFPVEICGNYFDFKGRRMHVAAIRDLTAQKQAEETLRKSEAELNRAQAIAHMGNWSWDCQNDVGSWSAEMYRIYGLTPGAFDQTFSGLARLIHPDDLPQLLKSHEALAQGRAFDPFEHRVIRPDGGIRVVQVFTAEIERDAAGEPIRIFGAAQDITERKRAEEELRGSEAKLRGVFECSRDAIGIALRGISVFANPAYLKLFGVEAQQSAGTPVINHIAPSHRPQVLLNIERRAAGETAPTFYETRGLKANGDEFDMEVSVSTYSLKGEVFTISTLRDITERKRIEASHSRLATVVEQATETIMITDAHGTIVYANPAFERTTGYTRAEAVGQNPRLLKSGRQTDEFYRQMWEVLKRGEPWHGHFLNRRKDGTLYEEEATITPVRDGSGKIINYVAVKRDVTREVQLERQFLQAQKMQSVGQLAGGVAHDFNNILAATMMRLCLLQQNTILTAEAQETVKELIEGAQRAANLTKQLLMFSRRSVMEVKLLDLNELMTNLLKMLGRLIGEHIVVRFDRREGLPAIEADPGMIEQVIMNLAVNARDAMPGGGNLAIAIEAVEAEAERVAGKPDVQPGQFLCLSVSDTGCGMDEETRVRLFEPFFTTKEPGKGTGLGLATVHGIVTQHKGWIEVESEAGKGATFKVFFPASAQKMPGATQSAKTVTVRGHETILVVEDEGSVRRLVALNLRKLGYTVFEVENGQAALDMWQQRRGEFDLLFSDMVMPEGLTGLDLAEKLKKEKPDLKVVISSGYSAEIAGQSRLDAQGIAYLQKPYRVEGLAQVVRDCLDGKC